MHTLWYTTLLAALVVWPIHLSELSVNGQLHPDTPARYSVFTSLREQARILDQWRDERVARIPDLLKRYGVDVWLVSIKESKGIILVIYVHTVYCRSANASTQKTHSGGLSNPQQNTHHTDEPSSSSTPTHPPSITLPTL